MTRYRIRAYAGLRHYLADGEEDAVIEAEPGLTVRALLERAHIPHVEVMQVVADGRRIPLDQSPPDGVVVEIFPIMAGG